MPGIVQWVNNHFENFSVFEDIAMGAVRYSPSIANAGMFEEHQMSHYPYIRKR